MDALTLPRRGIRLLKRMAFPERPSFSVGRPTPSAWRDDRLTLACLGHATVLMNVHGTWVLTDPALLDRVGFTLGDGEALGPHRLLPPALAIEELPRLDVVLLSHAHPDHMDLPTLARLPKDVTVIVPPRTADLVDALGFRDVRELAWGDVADVAGVRVTGMRVRHYGKRHLADRRKGRGYTGYVVEGGGQRVFFGGDTAHTELDGSLVPGGVDVAVLGIGGYEPFVWNHATPEQAFDMALQLEARFFLPMHWATFMLSDEPIEEPLARLLRTASGSPTRVVAEHIGDTFEAPPRGQS